MPRPEVVVGPTAKELRQQWRGLYTEYLDLIFEEFAAGKITVSPDEAMVYLEECLTKSLSDSPPPDNATSPPSNLRFNFAAYRRDAHHYAVERYYKTYFPRKRGGEPLSERQVDAILKLRRKGLNYAAIAEKWGQPKDRMRKRVAVAEKRWREAVERIEELKRRFPHLVAPVPGSKLAAPVKQSNRQKSKARRGK